MSWSVSAIGKPVAVAANIENAFSSATPCAEPEETVRQSARRLIADCLNAQRPDSVVQVSASGSMAQTYDQTMKTWGPPVNNQVEIKINPVYGFVE